MILGAVAPLPARSVTRFAMRVGLVLAEAVDRARAGAAVREHRHGRLRGARRRHRTATPVRLRVVGELAAGARRPSGRRGRGDPHHDRRADAGRRRRDRHGRASRVRDGDDVVIDQAARPGDHVRPAGGDLDAGQPVFDAGTVLTPAHLGVLASLDVTDVACHPRPRVGVLSTGDELVESGRSRSGGSATRTGRCCSPSLAEAGCEPVDSASRATTKHELETRDRRRGGRVRRAPHERRGVGGRLRLREGRARAARRSAWVRSRGRRSRSSRPSRSRSDARCRACRCSGCPAIPVSSRVSFELFARPALRRMMGRTDSDRDPGSCHRPHRDLPPARRQAAPRPGRVRRGRPLRRERAGSRRATCSRAWPPPTVSPLPTAGRGRGRGRGPLPADCAERLSGHERGTTAPRSVAGRASSGSHGARAPAWQPQVRGGRASALGMQISRLKLVAAPWEPERTRLRGVMRCSARRARGQSANRHGDRTDGLVERPPERCARGRRAVPTCACPVAVLDRSLRPPGQGSADLDHRPLQLPLHVLHAGRGHGLAARRPSSSPTRRSPGSPGSASSGSASRRSASPAASRSCGRTSPG